jgi:hypothetical protein
MFPLSHWCLLVSRAEPSVCALVPNEPNDWNWPDSDLPARPLFRRPWGRSGHQSANAGGRHALAVERAPAGFECRHGATPDGFIEHPQRCHGSSSGGGIGQVRRRRCIERGDRASSGLHPRR